jgi:hypothetical protein
MGEATREQAKTVAAGCDRCRSERMVRRRSGLGFAARSALSTQAVSMRIRVRSLARTLAHAQKSLQIN